MTLNGFPYAEIIFGADGLAVDAAARGTAPALALDPAVTDLLVLSHGWNDDADQARSLYDGITASMAQVGGAPPGLAVIGVVWPSKQFLVPESLATIAAGIAADPQARADFVGTVRAEISASAVASWSDPGDEQDLFFGMDPGALFDRLATDGADPIPSGITNVLDLATYYEMKARSGLVGRLGVASMLAAVRAARPSLRLHLAGHSFGSRVVASAVAFGDALPVSSAMLMQGALSHFGFARHWDGIHDGLFRPALVGGRVSGTVVVTYSARDELVGVAYALASRLARQVASDAPAVGPPPSAAGPIGGPNDRYGALGANGALATPESQWLTMLPVDTAYQLVPGTVANLDSKAYILNHFAVTGPEVAQALIAAING